MHISMPSVLVNHSLINITSAHSLFGVIVRNLRSAGSLAFSSSTTGIKKERRLFQSVFAWKGFWGVDIYTEKWDI